MSIKQIYIQLSKSITKTFRHDLQLHFLWSFFLCLLGVFWQPLVHTGFIATVFKETMDLWTKGHWSWDDFLYGTAGWIMAICFLGWTQ